MPKKTKIERWQLHLTKQQELFDKAKAMLQAMLSDLKPDDPAEIADVEKAISDHAANLEKLVAKIGAVK